MKYYAAATLFLASLQCSSAYGKPDTYYDQVQTLRVSVKRIDVFNVLLLQLKEAGIQDVTLGPVIKNCSATEMCIHIDAIERQTTGKLYVFISATAYRYHLGARQLYIDIFESPDATIKEQLFGELVDTLVLLSRRQKDQKK